MIDFHQRLTELSQRSKIKTCWKIRYRGEYLRMSTGKESWTKKSAAKAALMLEFETLFSSSCLWIIQPNRIFLNAI